MHLLQPELHTRRAFLRRSTQLGLAGTALPFALNLAAIGEAAAFSASDYKALVCVFLYGGNDYANTVVTYDDDSYNRYSAIRGGGAGQTAGGIAIAKESLTPTLLSPTIPLPGGRQYALHPAMTGSPGLFNSGKAAVQLNVGPARGPPHPGAVQQRESRSLIHCPPSCFPTTTSSLYGNPRRPKAPPWAGAGILAILHCRPMATRCSPASPSRATPCFSRATQRCSTKSAPAGPSPSTG